MKLSAVLVLLVAACGGDSGGGDVACTYPPQSASSGTECAQYHDLSSDRESPVKSACTQQSGVVSDECSTTNLLGCCTMMQGGFEVGTCVYADTGTSAADQKAGCESANGTWSTTP